MMMRIGRRGACGKKGYTVLVVLATSVVCIAFGIWGRGAAKLQGAHVTIRVVVHRSYIIYVLVVLCIQASTGPCARCAEAADAGKWRAHPPRHEADTILYDSYMHTYHY